MSSASDVIQKERHILVPSSNKKKKILLVLVVLVALGIAGYFIHKKYPLNLYNYNVTKYKPAQKYRAVLTNYCASWCSASINFMPVWDRFRQELRKSRPDIKTQTVVCDKKDNEIQCNNAGIDAYPTVILYQDGKSIPFEGARTILNLHEFIRLNTQPVKY